MMEYCPNGSERQIFFESNPVALVWSQRNIGFESIHLYSGHMDYARHCRRSARDPLIRVEVADTHHSGQRARQTDILIRLSAALQLPDSVLLQ